MRHDRKQQGRRQGLHRRTVHQGGPEAVDTYLAEDFINHDPPFGVTPDREGMRAAGG